MDYSYISNEGQTLFLYRYGAKLEFTSSTSCATFLQAIKDGRSTMLKTIMENVLFVDVVGGDADVATAIIDDYFGKKSGFYMIGSADDFLAAEFGAATLEDAFPNLFKYLVAIGFESIEKTLELMSTKPTQPQMITNVFEHLHTISQDPIKKKEWLTEHAAARAKRASKDPRRISDLQKSNGPSKAMWSIMTYNAANMEKFTFDGKLPISMVDGYTIVQQPEPSFTFGSETLAWYADWPWFAYGGDGGAVTWKTITGRRFGVDIWIPLVFGGIGSDPYYSVWLDSFDKWVIPPGGPSAPYQFPGGWGYNVKVLPTCNGKELFIEVDVKVDKTGGNVDL